MGSSSYNLFQSMEPQLPPGFRFHPTDEELISYYLLKKVTDSNFTCKAIAEIDLNKCEPWQLPEKAKMGEKEWYFYSLRDRKYPTGLRTNRATECGYWKATGKDREIHTSKTHTLVGMKKTLVFYRGRAPKGEKTNWVMHEYRLDGKFSCLYISRSAKDEWVISRLFRKNNSGSTTVHGGSKQMMLTRGINICSEVSSSSSVSLSLPPLFDSSPYAATATSASTTTDLEISSSYDVNHHSIKEHVPCFSNIIPTTTTGPPPPPAGFNHYSSLHQFNLPPPADQAPVFGSPLDPYAVFGCQPFSRSSAVTTFPSLGSLQENLHLSSFNMAAANASNENDGGAGPYGSIGNWAAPVSLNKGGGGHSELDCMWRF